MENNICKHVTWYLNPSIVSKLFIFMNEGACWAFVAAGAIESMYLIKVRPNPKFGTDSSFLI